MSKRCTYAAQAAYEAVHARVEVLLKQRALVCREDPDGIHDMRVASRRLRAVLRAFRPALPKTECEAFRALAGEITRFLGRARELDVMIMMLDAYRKETEGAPRRALAFVLRGLRVQRQAAAGDCAQAVALADSREFRTLAAFILEERRPAKECLLTQAQRRLEKDFSALCAQYQAWLETGGEESLHLLRIAFKKFRYACELYAPLYGEAMPHFLATLKKAQQVLGDWNDSRVLRDAVMDAAAQAPPRLAAAFPALIAHFDAQAAQYQATFRESAAGFFDPIAQENTRAFFAAPIRACCSE